MMQKPPSSCSRALPKPGDWLTLKSHSHLRPHVEKLPEPHKSLLMKLREPPEARVGLLLQEQEKDHAERIGLESALSRSADEEKRLGGLQRMIMLRAQRVTELQRAIKALDEERAKGGKS